VERMGLGVDLEDSVETAAPARAATADPPGERRVLVAVLAINLGMFLGELVTGLWAGSTGLVADSLDMLADASVYAIALLGAGASLQRQHRAARTSGWLQLGLAGLVLVEVVRRAIEGGEPRSTVMMAMGVLALLANVTCLVLLARHRSGGAHMRASWIFTTNDVLANLGVILAGQLVAVTGSAWPDLLVGTAIAVLVASGALRILRMTR
jgi:cation diffusion facilitator family transporter